MKAMCRRFEDHGFQGVRVVDVGGESNWRKGADLMSLVFEFLESMPNDAKFSVTESGEFVASQYRPRIVCVYICETGT